MSTHRRLALANLRISTSSLPPPNSPSPIVASSLRQRRHAVSTHLRGALRDLVSPARDMNSEHLDHSAVAAPSRSTFLGAIDEVTTSNIGNNEQGPEEHHGNAEPASKRCSRFQHRVQALKALTRHASPISASASPLSPSSGSPTRWSFYPRISTVDPLPPPSLRPGTSPPDINDSRFRARSPGGALNSSPLSTLERRSNLKMKRHHRRTVVLDGELHCAPCSPLSPLFRPYTAVQPPPLSPGFNPLRVGEEFGMSQDVRQAIEHLHETNCQKGDDWEQLGILGWRR